MLDFRIQTFLCVCRTMNFTAAAETLHITQPAVSQHIRFLEQQYGVPLFERDGKYIRLTPAGVLLRDTARTIQNDTRTLQKRMQTCGISHKTLVCGVTMTIGEYAVTAPLAQYMNAHPDTDVQLQYDNTSVLLQCLREGRIDFALVEGYFGAGPYETQVYRTEPYIAVCAAGHRLAGGGPYSLRDLLTERLLVREPGSGTREILERGLGLHGLSVEDFAHVAQVGNMHAIVSLLTQNCGVAFLYQAAVERELAQGTLVRIPLRDFEMEHDFTFLWNRDSVFAPEYRAVCSEWMAYDTKPCKKQGEGVK